MTEVRWGVLGTARINRRLLPAMRAARRSTVTAVGSRDAARAAAYAAEWNIPAAHASYDALLRDRDVDAVYVSLPNALHVEWTLRALDAGKHVLCEKPLAATPDDVDRIAAVATAQQRVVAEGFMYRHEPLAAALRALLAKQTIGPVRTVHVTFTFELTRSQDIRLDAALGGGSLWDVGCYGVSLARHLLADEPQRVMGVASWAASGVDEAFTGILEFAGGTVATVHSSFRAGYRTSLEVGGRTGVVRVNSPFRPGSDEFIEILVPQDPTVAGTRGSAPTVKRVSVPGSPVLFVRQVEDFVAAVLDGRTPAITLAESRGNAAALAALYASARSGRAVSI